MVLGDRVWMATALAPTFREKTLIGRVPAGFVGLARGKPLGGPATLLLFMVVLALLIPPHDPFEQIIDSLILFTALVLVVAIVAVLGFNQLKFPADALRKALNPRLRQAGMKGVII